MLSLRALAVLALLIALDRVPSARADASPVTPGKEPPEKLEPTENSEWSHHFQATTVTQGHPAFAAPYSGQLSLSPANEVRTSVTSTLFIGHRLWTGACVFANPEESMGAGLSGTHGIAAFPNGEIYRVDDPSPKTNLSRLFFQQDFALGGGQEKIEDDLNQFAALKSVERVTLVAGKFSLNDYFDNNAYSHDPRTQFLNWALMDTGAWDYAADTRGYIWGVYAELHLAQWSYRLAVVQEPALANGLDLDGDIAHAHSEDLEIEYRYRLAPGAGKARLLGYMNQADMGSYGESLAQAGGAGSAPDITQTRAYRTKYGLALNVEQALTEDLGVFSRLGWNDGKTETWAFTEIDRSFSVGASLKGSAWRRPADTVGLAALLDGLAKDHADYLSAGGVGFILGDGRLSYAPEQVVEAYYSYQAFKALSLTGDFQFVNHPGFNADRGPVPVFALRAHLEL